MSDAEFGSGAGAGGGDRPGGPARSLMAIIREEFPELLVLLDALAEQGGEPRLLYLERRGEVLRDLRDIGTTGIADPRQSSAA